MSRLVCVLLAVGVMGCETIWNWTTSGEFEEGTAQMLTQAGQGQPALDCDMIGTSRAGVCLAKLKDAPGLAKWLGATPYDASVPGMQIRKNGCRARDAFRDLKGARVWLTKQTPPTLKGVGLERWHLYWRPATGQSCVEADIPYG